MSTTAAEKTLSLIHYATLFEALAARAREFFLPGRHDLPIQVADPTHLLANKIAVHRAKDRPHVAVLRRFVEEEVVLAFQEETQPRRRIEPAQRLLDALRGDVLDEHLADRLLPLARMPADFRFLARHVPTRRQADALADAAPDDTRDDVRDIAARRNFKRA